MSSPHTIGETSGVGVTPPSIYTVMDLSDTDPARDEALFDQGLRRLVSSLTA